MADYSHFFWIGAAGQGLGTLAFLRMFLVDARNRAYHGLLVGITGIATVAYALMALGVGVAGSPEAPVFLTRYADWAATTPLIILYLGLLAGLNRRSIAGLVAVDLVMIGAGTAAAMTDGLAKWGLYAIGSLAFAVLVYALTTGIREAVSERPGAVRAMFGKLRTLTLVTWLLYPTVWLLGASGIAVLDPSIEVLVVTYADLISKVGFGFVAMNSQRSLAKLPKIESIGSFRLG
jgi:sensory rhodopsin